MTEQEKAAIKQSMSDGYFIKGGKQPRVSEIRACLRFFEEAAVIRNSKEPDSVDVRELALIMMFHTVIDRDVLISGFDTEKGEPMFIKNGIKVQ